MTDGLGELIQKTIRYIDGKEWEKDTKPWARSVDKNHLEHVVDTLLAQEALIERIVELAHRYDSGEVTDYEVGSALIAILGMGERE